MADWSGLLGWSTKYHDGTQDSPKEFQAMSAEDRKWLEEAMHEHSFNDADRLKEICEELVKDVANNFKAEEGNYEKTIDRLEEC